VDFTALYRSEARRLAGWFLRRVRDPEVAADLTAETFAAAFAGRSRFDPARGEPAAWLYGIARHQLARYERRGRVDDRARRRAGMERLELTDTALDRLATEAILDGLPDGRLVRARIIDDRPYAEVAADAGITEPAARKRVSRALARLRKEFS
jgi:RNA polymerase sigma-70 factor (ECF subfamily)